MAISFVDFKNEYFDDFKSLILPNIYHELISSTVMAEPGLFLIGALDGERPVGALVARLSEDRELDIASIFVDRDYRRQQIGSSLFDYLLSETIALIEEASPMEDPNIGIMANAEYSLPSRDAEIFRKFLSSKGFTMHTDYEKLLYLEPEEVKRLAEKSSGRSKRLPLDEELKAADELLAATGLQIDEKMWFYSGSEEDPSALLLLGYGFHSLFLISQKISPARDAEELKDMLYDALKEISRKYEGEALIVNMEYNLEEYYDLLKDAALVCLHSQSAAALAFSAKEAD